MLENAAESAASSARCNVLGPPASAARCRRVDDHRQLAPPAVPRSWIRDQLAHEVRYVGHVGAVRSKEAAHEGLVQRVFRHVTLQKRVGANRHPLYERASRPDIIVEKVCGSLIVPGRGNQTAKYPQDHLLENAPAYI